jgi:hypothetical protein
VQTEFAFFRAPARLVLVLALGLLGAGCLSRPSAQQIATADYGPFPRNYEEIIRARLNATLFDPESARIEFDKGPTRAWNALGGTLYGYAVCGWVNAKNRFGGYTGRHRSYWLIRDNRIVREYDDTSDGIRFAEAACSSLDGSSEPSNKTHSDGATTAGAAKGPPGEVQGRDPAAVSVRRTAQPTFRVVDRPSSEVLDYEWNGPRALVRARASSFEIAVHPSRPLLMVRPGEGQWRSAASGMSHQAWIDVASGFVAPAGCSIVQLAPIAAPTVWEASYQCAEGTDLRQLMIRQRSEIERGGALRVGG